MRRSLLSVLLLLIMQFTLSAKNKIAYNKQQLLFDGLALAEPQTRLSTLTLVPTDSKTTFPSMTIKAPQGKWNFLNNRFIETTLTNKSTFPQTIYFWAVASVGYDSALGQVKLPAGASKKCKIDLEQAWGDGTRKVNPAHITALQVMLKKGKEGSILEVGEITFSGKASKRKAQKRLKVPAMTNQKPAAGRRVRHQLPEYMGTDLYHSLYLPEDWTPTKRYPVIVEYSGNRWFGKSCYSTGRPEDSKMGYGMSKGKGYIWINAPFVDPKTKSIQVSGWGDPDATADYAIKMVNTVCENYGGDPSSVIMTGFSRGAISLGYIGRRNDRIADVWLAFHACQHFDGDGWRGAKYDDALNERGPRIKGRATFHTDNDKPKVKEIFNQLKFPVVYANSGFGGHADTMFLDDRRSTVQLREWLTHIITTKPGTYSISGNVTDSQSKGIAGVKIQSGETHFTYTDSKGNYTLTGLISGQRTITATKDSSSASRSLKLDTSNLNDVNFHLSSNSNQ